MSVLSEAFANLFATSCTRARDTKKQPKWWPIRLILKLKGKGANSNYLKLILPGATLCQEGLPTASFACPQCFTSSLDSCKVLPSREMAALGHWSSNGHWMVIGWSLVLHLDLSGLSSLSELARRPLSSSASWRACWHGGAFGSATTPFGSTCTATQATRRCRTYLFCFVLFCSEEIDSQDSEWILGVEVLLSSRFSQDLLLQMPIMANNILSLYTTTQSQDQAKLEQLASWGRHGRGSPAS